MPEETIDMRIGERVQVARDVRRVKATNLAEALGISYQQLRKYERGQNRISVSVLFRVSQILDLDIGFFFRNLERGSADAASSEDVLGSDLGAALERVDDLEVREKLFDLIRALERSRIAHATRVEARSG